MRTLKCPYRVTHKRSVFSLATAKICRYNYGTNDGVLREKIIILHNQRELQKIGHCWCCLCINGVNN